MLEWSGGGTIGGTVFMELLVPWCQHYICGIIARDTIASGIFGGRGDGLHISDLLCLLISGWVGITTGDQHRNPKSNERDQLVVQSTRGWWESGSMVAPLVG